MAKAHEMLLNANKMILFWYNGKVLKFFFFSPSVMMKQGRWLSLVTSVASQQAVAFFSQNMTLVSMSALFFPSVSC